MDARTGLILELERQLRERRLIWLGTRGTDARPMLALGNTEAVCSLIAPIRSSMLRSELCLEVRSDVRVNLDAYDFDDDHSPVAVRLRQDIRRLVRHPCVVVPYRSLRFVSTISYPGASLVEVFGLFAERQRSFEHKPWVESGLRDAGVPTIPWTYYATDDPERICEALSDQASVLRAAHSSGGTGLALVRTRADVQAYLARVPEGFVALSRFLEPNIPININACVFGDRSVTLHNVSIQLIGIEGCTALPFGYCGNDFAQARSLEPSLLDDVARSTRRVGEWLADRGYLGAYGVDAIVHDGRVLISEVNPRFQGSSELSARVDAAADRPDVYMAHLAAYLDLRVDPGAPLSDTVPRQAPLAQALIHNLTQHPSGGITASEKKGWPDAEVQLRPARSVQVSSGAIRGRLLFSRAVTEDGHTVRWTPRAALTTSSKSTGVKRQL